MKAARIEEYGSTDVIEIEEIDRPRVGTGEVLVEVYASSINPIDIAIREGYMSQMTELPLTLGLDAAGVVMEVGEEVSGLSRGYKVYGEFCVRTKGSGAFAQYAKAPAPLVAKMPSNLNFIEAGAAPLTGTSAVQALTEHIGLQPRQKILIHGGAGGIGTMAIQIGKRLGAYVAATATGEGIDYVKQLGVDKVIDYKAQAFDELLSGYDAVLDTVSGETYERSFKVLKPGGIIVSMLHPPDEELEKKYEVKAIFQLTNVSTKNLNKLRGYFEEGAVTIEIEKIFPLDQIREAFKAKETGDVRGKIAIEIKK